MKKVAAKVGFKQREFTEQEIVERCLLPLFNVGCEVLDEGVAVPLERHRHRLPVRLRLSAYRGGPMFWAEKEVGLKDALAKVKAYSALVGEKWTSPSPLLERLVAEGKTLASLEQG